MWVGAVQLEVRRLSMCFRLKYPEPWDFLGAVRAERKVRAEDFLDSGAFN